MNETASLINPAGNGFANRNSVKHANADNMQITTTYTVLKCSVPARLGKGQGAKEIGHNLARE